MTQTNFTNIAKVWGFILAVVILLSADSTAVAQCTLVCNNLVQISLDEDCTVDIDPDMILEGGGCPNGNLTVEMKINGQWVPATVNSNHINQTIQVRVRDLNTGNTCWGYIHVEDKLAPELICTDINLSCAITTYTPDYLYNQFEISDAYPEVIENCGNYTTSYFDTWYDLPCGASINGHQDVSAYVKRIWTAVDQSGNQANCTQYLYFERRHVGDVLFPADVTVSCTNPTTAPSATGAPYISEFGLEFPLYPQSTYCEMNVVYSDQILPICDGTHKILRTWTVYDWCMPTTPFPPSTNPLYYIQLIKVQDAEGPTVECPEDITETTNPFDCERDFDLPDVLLSDGCSRIKSIRATYSINGVGHTLYGSLTTFPGNNLWNPDTLGVLGVAENLPLGVTQVTYIAEDDCGNTSTCLFDVTIEDNTPPASVCDEFTQVSLGANGTILVNASTFDDGSYDNCSPVTFKARRMDANGCQPSNRFYDQVKFCCEDINDTITVVFRVYDVPVPAGEVSLEFQEEHSNDCMVQVFVDDKLKPSCNAPSSVTVSCENFDPSLWAYGFATATDNCCIDTITATANYTQFDTVCNKGTILRTFRSVDCGGLSTTCTQRVTVNYEQDYYVKFPNDVIVTVCDGTGNYGEPTFFGEDCELLAVSHEDVIYTVVPDACFKIERTWNIINWCTYNPNISCIDVPNPNPNATVNHSSNLPGPTVSPAGTPAPWNPTVVKINPTDPTATNYSIFWSANANCYKYKQIIKVIDTQKPLVNCPASPVYFDDKSPNDPYLWNEMYWWDGANNSHDLCEGASDLSITATDLCSGANINIRYLLFLDLDNNGTMETVVSSTNLPGYNTVYFDNAGNANFLGGTPQQFDERPVLPNQKYGFTIQTTTSGNNKTASVRWNTQQQPTTYVTPELPYGTHKIKWIVEDGCGNEQVCEYTFTVRDKKAPTVVCINGLSVNIMPTKMIALWANDFLKYTEDNCTPGNLLKIGIRKSGTGTGFPYQADGVTPQTGVTFDCTELGTRLVELWSIDLAGNADYCETYVIVQDNLGACNAPGGNATIAGLLKTESDKGLLDGNVELNGTPPNGLPPFSNFDVSDNDGLYVFSNALPVSSDYTVTPTKDNDPLNGVSTFDLVLINKHILGLEPLGSPYKMIAADANNSRSITTFDIVEFRKLILGLYTQLPGNTSWRFVDKGYAFPNTANPFQEIFPETKSVANVQASQFTDDFVAVKVGDVNGNATANLSSADDRSAGTAFFNIADRAVKAGTEVVVHFNAADQLAAYQFTMNLNGLEVVELLPGENMTAENFAVFAADHALTAAVDANAGAFAIKFRATQNGSLSRMLGVSSRITKAEAYSAAGDHFDVVFRFNGANGTVLAGAGFELLQNTPNPVRQATDIAFNLPEASDATLTISNAEGRVLKMVKGSYAKGLNTVTIDRAELSAGILFYQLDTPTNSATKKMIVVE